MASALSWSACCSRMAIESWCLFCSAMSDSILASIASARANARSSLIRACANSSPLPRSRELFCDNACWSSSLSCCSCRLPYSSSLTRSPSCRTARSEALICSSRLALTLDSTSFCSCWLSACSCALSCSSSRTRSPSCRTARSAAPLCFSMLSLARVSISSITSLRTDSSSALLARRTASTSSSCCRRASSISSSRRRISELAKSSASCASSLQDRMRSWFDPALLVRTASLAAALTTRAFWAAMLSRSAVLASIASRRACSLSSSSRYISCCSSVMS
mmetsp:Transcript_13081/g.31052  ORF Transcript_13081/g.31052 Transcript_13081/m.31052 type:complete len:279 (+) Transcript_13081:1574-2410(+)